MSFTRKSPIARVATAPLFIPLEAIHVASPCHADWEAMSGDERARFCGSCQKHVYNLSEMTRAQAESLITEKEGHLCVRYYQRADGTILTQDCPIGLLQADARMKGRMVVASQFAALFTLCGALLAGTLVVAEARPLAGAPAPIKHAQTKTLPPLMGKIAVPAKTPMPPITHTMGIIAPRPTPAPKKPVKTHTPKKQTVTAKKKIARS